MSTALRIYEENGRKYKPDRCEPLKNSFKAGKIQLDAWGRFAYPGHRLDDDLLPGINSIGCWDAYFPQDWGLEWHRNEGIEISFLETGHMPFALDGSEYMVNPNELVITRPWQPHKVGNPTISIGRWHWFILDVDVRQPHQEWNWPKWIVLNRADLDELTTMLRQNEQPVWKANDDIKRCFQKIGALLKNDPVNSESMVIIYINEIFIHLLELFRKGNIGLNQSLTESRRTIELFIDHLAHNIIEPWTIESMAEHCHMGVTRFTYYFKMLTNKTPMQYLNFIRIEQAAKLLLNDREQHISAVCYECGFSSTEYFSTVFRKVYKCSPTSFRLLYEMKNGYAKHI
ncbi:AraC family transcriptional regulator [Mucilaginibacter hurinus]|uniref:AraC family transcriptional regulator n=1 Tax=Mucilaginibacter hurinus TaxID=2201324 RepID=A0A367GPA1_9SPHI|nr:AraC family transcriptional regulator [Mucilaginibacter hurinus]RCH55279.1 AraC family transcriptional regulator [Mucilaginibacter hurinus]